MAAMADRKTVEYCMVMVVVVGASALFILLLREVGKGSDLSSMFEMALGCCGWVIRKF